MCYGGVAQLGEYHNGIVGVEGSIPFVSTITNASNHSKVRCVFLLQKIKKLINII